MYRIAFAILLLSSPSAAQDLAATLPVVVTTGEATLQRAPDRAFVTASVETRARNPRDAQRQNADAMDAVQKRLADARIPKDAIRTLGYQIQQEFDYVQGRRVARDFVARNTVEVRLDEVSRAGEILDAVVQAGATSVGGVRFDLQDRAAVEREALRLAVTDARARAEAAAAGARQSIDRVIRIEDAREGGVPPQPMLAMARAEQAQDTPIEPGVIEIRARVTFTASLK
ncbi:MAG: SIMPL domain-containing protein [Acidobacteria bacterium]|nr:SIMPL domain-containing protein [Acidobacteriota bacterium]